MTGFAGTPIAFEDVKVGQSVQVTETWGADGDHPEATVLFATTVHAGVVSSVREGGFDLNNGRVYFSANLEEGEELDILLLEDVAPEPLAPGYYFTKASGYYPAVRYWNGEKWSWSADDNFHGFIFGPEFTVVSDRIEIKELTA